MSAPATTLSVSPGRSTAAPHVRPDLTSFNRLRLIVDRETAEDEADARAGLMALAEWEADNRITVSFEQVRAAAEARDAAEQ